MTLDKGLVKADLGTLGRVTRAVILGMSNDEVVYWRAQRQNRALRVSKLVDNDFEAWRLIHMLRSKGFLAEWNESAGRVESNASSTTVVKYYTLTRD